MNAKNPLHTIATRDRRIADLEAQLTKARDEAAYLRKAGETLADVVQSLQMQLAGAWEASRSREIAGVFAWLSQALDASPAEAGRLVDVIRQQ